MSVMRHRVDSMSASTSTSASNPENIWFIDSGTSNHMSSHEEWFQDLREPDWPDYVETGDDTTHPIRHVRNFPFGKEREQTCIKNVLHVSTITKNLVSVGQIVEQGMQVRFKTIHLTATNKLTHSTVSLVPLMCLLWGHLVYKRPLPWQTKNFVAPPVRRIQLSDSATMTIWHTTMPLRWRWQHIVNLLPSSPCFVSSLVGHRSW